MPHLVATLIYLSQKYSYYIRGDRSPLTKDGPHAERVNIIIHCVWMMFEDLSPIRSLTPETKQSNNPFRAGTVFRRQNLTSVDVRF